MTYTADDVIKILGAAGVLLGIVGGIAVNIIVALRTSKKVDANTKIAQEVSSKADVISGHVNSQASSSATEIAGLRDRVEMLHGLLAKSQNIQLATANQSAREADRDKDLK